MDPIFRGEETVERASPKATLLFQFFLFPLMIVVASVGVFLVFGAIGGTDKTASEHLDDVVSGGENVQKQSVQQLAAALAEERRRVDDGSLPLAKAFFSTPAFREKLVAAFDDSFGPDKTAARQVALAVCLAAVAAPETVDVLSKRLASSTASDVRCAIVAALGAIPGDRPVPVLVEALKDPDDALRNSAVHGLSRHRSEAVTAALRGALSDTSQNVQLTAASGLAVSGDAAGKDLVARLLDPTWVEANVVEAKSGHSSDESGPELKQTARWNALSNGLVAAFALRADDLKPKVEALTRDGDDRVRRLARDVLDQWAKPR